MQVRVVAAWNKSLKGQFLFVAEPHRPFDGWNQYRSMMDRAHVCLEDAWGHIPEEIETSTFLADLVTEDMSPEAEEALLAVLAVPHWHKGKSPMMFPGRA